MSKYIKIGLATILAVIVLIMGGNLLVEKKIRDKLQEINGYKIETASIDVNLLTRSVSAVDIDIDDTLKNTFSIKKIALSGISITSLFGSDSIVIGELKVENLDALLHRKKSRKNSSKKQKQLIIKKLVLKDTRFTYKDTTEKNIVKTEKINGHVFDLHINPASEHKKIDYKKIDFEVDNVLLPMNYYQNFLVGKLILKDDYIKTASVKIKTIYDKNELQKHLKTERDWISLTIDSLNIYNYKRDKLNENYTYSSEKIDIIQGNLEVYRDKGLPDDTRYKPLYSKALRNLPFDIDVPELNIYKSRITYEEKVNDSPGKIVFTDVSSTIKNINTLKEDGETLIDIESKFMGDADFKLLWKFNINNKADFFTLHGKMEHLNAEKINDFVEPNMNIITSGSITSLLFDVDANENNATGTFQMKYDDFVVNIKKKNKNVVNKFISTIANIFVKNTKEDNEKVDIKVERNKEKSFFNYFWLCVREGTIQTVLK
ncbi:hypothetical protein [Galbibacter pacificus]|uniref:DUF748 domain-containing protein n=1 Tax=Galbibacter pacificus TaxID=2996052 RepID=A0ABT6FS08_9FLAO|nr:hypothetical protein [Galbibacter pacificus]MDG3582989.1 hypothetical protein [Galbibacter pacificus]MDG3585892.1 hypothetical protein [Galbibacter pacificus]